MGPLVHALLAVTDRGASPEASRWLAGIVGAPPGGIAPAAMLDAFAAAGRLLGGACLGLTPRDLAELRSAGLAWAPEGWRADDLGRAVLLLAAAERLDAAAFVGLVDETYRHGSVEERRAVLRALPLLPDPERFLAIAVDACRSHIQPVFEALACENPYPARHFPEPAFNQMVLKALFTDVALARIAGLAARVTPELTRMALAYARERELAGRSVPADVGRLTGRLRSEP